MPDATMAAICGSSPHTRGAPVAVQCPCDGVEDHPRIRGEHKQVNISVNTFEGSSPHTRGAPTAINGRRRRRRIIPAYAGSTPTTLVTMGSSMDHPRIRGEHFIPSHSPLIMDGSSPHTRGARPNHTTYRRRHGIIPAYAGSTPCGMVFREDHWDHPRIRGEHWSRGGVRMPCLGSSPHTRGAHGWRCEFHLMYRIIPAYAGSTSGHRSRSGRRRGSSPHTRGAPVVRVAEGVLMRIIPAYAGSTTSSAWGGQPAPDHPRIRGEHSSEPGLDVGQAGSSPHTRGAPCSRATPSTIRGIIPAYAGSTLVVAGDGVFRLDHPRIRGEHQLALIKPGDLVGSSPHTRGAHAVGRQWRPASGIIPAYAGSTQAGI